MRIAPFFSFLIGFLLINVIAYPQEISGQRGSIPVSEFKHLSSENGLSQNGIEGIQQDKKGFIWIATKNGLNKYDGYSFKVYTNNPFDSTSLCDNYIAQIFEDDNGNMWILTNSGEVDVMDGETELFYKLPFVVPNPTHIVQDHKGDIWIGTYDSGLFRIARNNNSPSGYRLTNFKHNADDPESIIGNYVTSIAVDKDNVLWLATFSGLDKLSGDRKIFHHFFRGSISSVLVDNDTTLWIGGQGKLIHLNKNSASTQSYSVDYKIVNKLNHLRFIVKDSEGNLWMGSWTDLISFDPVIKSFSYINKTDFPALSCIYSDKRGNIWVGTWYGVYIHFPESHRFKSFPDSKYKGQFASRLSVRSIFLDSQNDLWFGGAARNIYKWNIPSDKLTTYNKPNEIWGFGNVGAASITGDYKGNVWFGTVNCLYRVNMNTDEVKHFSFNNDPGQNVYGVFLDHSGSLWIITEKYLSKLVDGKNGLFKNYVYNKNPVPGADISPTSFYEDKENNIWFTSNLGLIKFNAGTCQFTYYKNNPSKKSSIYNNNTDCICPDPKEPENKLWIGTAGGGLNLLDKLTGKFEHLGVEDGLPSNVVYAILQGIDGNLWISTNRGISKFEPGKRKFTNYDVNDGLQNNEFNTGAFYKSRNGELFFGGISGINYFYPSEIKIKNFTPGIFITDFKLMNKQVTLKEDKSVLKKVISQTDEIKLPYSDNILSFGFALLDYYAPEKNLYAYKLDGYNSNWIQLGRQREIMFTGLNPGTYTLKVKGSNSDGVWNNNYASLKIIITPPWWKTWWAYSIFGLFFITGIYWIRKYELNRVQLKNDLKLEKVETDTLRNLDQMKSRFFTNISHEFRTPLTLILGQIENIMSSDIDVVKKGKLQVANRNARRLMTLINQLLDISRLEAGSMELDAKEYNIVSFLKNLFYSFESLAESKNINLEFNSVSENIIVVFDPDKMEKIFYNLISNAFKFTQAGGMIKVTVKTDHSFVKISIKDTGIGIPANRIKKIFDRFYQVDSSQTREYEGTGIGLALTNELIELHKGKIDVASKEGEGSEFILTFPLSGPKSISTEIVEPPVNSSAEETDLIHSADSDNGLTHQTGTKNNRKEILLIVEDNPDVRTYIIEHLEKKYATIEAVNGEDGILKATDSIPDLIITDVMMPKMNGYEFSLKIRTEEKTSHIPIIMLTAKGALDDKIEGLETGIDAYITKPFSVKELTATVKNLIIQRKKLRKRFSKATIIKPSEVSAVSSDQIFLEKTIAIIEKHFEDENFGVGGLASGIGMSLSQLNRKLNALIDQSSGKLIRSFRLQRAADLLIKNAGNVTEICFRVGFNDQGYFAKAFKKQFGCTPTEYKKTTTV